MDLLPSLKKISLLHLPELKSISGSQCIASRLEKMVIYNCPKLKTIHPLHTCSKDVIEIKGESKWWESNKLGWSSELHDYLVRVFIPFKVDNDEDEDLIDEVAEAVRISLKSHVTEINKDLVINMGMEMEDKFEEYQKEIGTSNSTSDRNKGDVSNMNLDMKEKFEAHPKEIGTTESTIERNEHLVLNMDMKREDKLEISPKEIGTSKSTCDEFVPVELCSSEFSTTNLKNMWVNKFYRCLVAEPRKYPEFSFASLASTLEVVSLAGYDLSDDSIPRNLSSLSSLWELDLSFTQIATLHKGIKWPNELKFLKLNGCRNLRILSELPLLQVLAVNECRALERVCFGLNKLQSAPVSLLSHGCDRLVEVDSVFRVDPIESIDAKVTKNWGLDNLKFLTNVEVELCNNMTRTRKKLPLKGLAEFGILSSFLPKIMIPNFFSNMQRSSCITFVVPSTTQNLNLLRGMNLCIVYECSKEHKHEQYNDFHIDVTNGRDKWTYYPTIYGDGEDHIMWLSYWDTRYYQMEAGDTMTVLVVVGSGFEVKECGTCLVYEGEPLEIITPVTTCESSVIKKTHMNLSSPLSSISNVHSRWGHHLFLDPLKYLP